MADEEEYLEPAAAAPAPPAYADVVSRSGESERLMELTFERLLGVHGVLGIVIFRSDGSVLKSSLEPKEAVVLATGASQALARAVGCVDEPLSQLVIRTTKHEMLLSCSERFGSGEGYGIAVMQDPNLVVEKKVGVKELVAKMRKLGLEIPPGADRAWLLELLENEMMRRGM
eukprot:scaffold11300_cov32-Tisochrysis_lutea.AAC.2